MIFENIPLLSLLIFTPLFGSGFIMLTPNSSELPGNNGRLIALVVSLLTFALAIVTLCLFNINKHGFQFIERCAWSIGLNSSYYIGIDGLSLSFILLTTFIVPIIIIASWHSIKVFVREYMILFLILETIIIGAFSALDFILFYLFFEGVLIPMFFIIGIWGGENRIYATLKFLLYTFAGSVLMLIAILVIYSYTQSMDIVYQDSLNLPLHIEQWIWLAFFASFAIKIPMWPFHTWLPDAHVEAPTGGSIILSSILLKLGGYGFLRFSIPLFPHACQNFAPYIFYLSSVAIVYTALVALVQKDMKKLIAYASIAHMGFATFGMFTLTYLGLQGAIFQMVSHGLISTGLFLAIGIIYDRMHTRQIADYEGIVERMPNYAINFMIITLAAISLPGTCGFVGEIMVLIAAFELNGMIAFIMGIGTIIGTAYMLWLYRRVLFGKLDRSQELIKISDLNRYEKGIMVTLSAGVIVLGIFPQPLINLINQALPNILYNHIQGSQELLNPQEKLIRNDN